MKKFLSLFLALVLALSMFTAVPVFATDYDDYNLCHGKKAGEIYGFLESNIQASQALEGCEEITALLVEAKKVAESALATQREGFYYVVEVDKDKTEIPALCSAMDDTNISVAEGLASSLGDPSACARNLDVIEATCCAAEEDANKALEKNDAFFAERAIREYNDALDRFYNAFCTSVGDYELYRTHLDDGFDLYNRVTAFRERAENDVASANSLLDSAEAQVMQVAALYGEAYEKANALAAAAPDDKKADYQQLASYIQHGVLKYDEHNKIVCEIYYDFGVDKWERVSIDFTDLDYKMISLERNLMLFPDKAKKTVEKLLPQFFLTANNLTYNGKAQKLITLGKTLPEGDTPTGYVIKKASADLFPDFDYNFVTGSAVPAAEEFTAGIPTAKAVGTYYVYYKFADGSCMVTKATIKAQKKNTLTVKGKTKTLKAKTLKKKNITVKRADVVTVSKPKGTVTYAKASGNKKITVNKKNGNITVKKGLKKGTYKVKVKVTAAGTKTFKKATKTVTVTIKVK